MEIIIRDMDTLAQMTRKLLNVEMAPEHWKAFQTYAASLLEWNTHTNLTAITNPQEIETKHFLDSLTLTRVLRPVLEMNVVDVGTGAGFPGLPLKVMYPQIRLTLIEATGKKTAFLEHVTQLLNLRDVRVIHERAEMCGQQTEHREQYDLAVARAVSLLPALLEYLLPLCRVGGTCIAYKGESAPQEAAQAESALRILGGKLKRLVPVELPGVAETRYLVVVEKTAATPASYPRRPGMPVKRPL